MSKNYEKINRYYNFGLWSKQRVYNMVEKYVITQEEYEMITGETYE